MIYFILKCYKIKNEKIEFTIGGRYDFVGMQMVSTIYK